MLMEWRRTIKIKLLKINNLLLRLIIHPCYCSILSRIVSQNLTNADKEMR